MPRPLFARLRALAPRDLKRLERAIVDSSRTARLTYERGDGKTIVIPLITAPAIVTRADIAYLHGVVTTLTGAFVKTAKARLVAPDVQEIIPVEPVEEEWLHLTPPGRAPLVARWDFNLDLSSGGAGARGGKLFEVNGSAIGGMYYGPRSSEIVLEHVASLGGDDLAVPDAMADLWLDLISMHSGVPTPRLVWLEDKTWDAGITEGPTLVEELTAAGQRAFVGDPRELELDRESRLVYKGVPIDVVYRSIEVRELAEIEAEHGPLTAMREAFRRNQVVSPPEGDLDHKSMLEIWSSKRFARLFSAAERAVFRRHVPWTRLLGERKTEGPDGREIDLPRFALKKQRHLVLKPNRSCGGEGVRLGKATPKNVWERAVARAVSGKDPAVVQALVDTAHIETVRLRKGRPRVERHCTTYGLLGAPNGLGILGRAAPFPVVNVSRGGGLLGVLVTPGRGRR